MSPFTLIIRTPDREVYRGGVLSIGLSSEMGSLKLLPKHADFIGTIGYTRIEVELSDATMEYIGKRGLLTMENKTNTADLLLMECHPIEELSLPTVESYLAYVEDMLQKGEDLSSSQLKFMESEKIMLVKQLKDLSE